MDSPQCHLIYFTGRRSGEAEHFQSARISIGRAANSDFRIDPGYEEVTQHHAEILFEDGTFVLYDLGAKTGTYVNGQRVKERRPLDTEDYIRFGANGLEVIFRTGAPAPGYQPIPALTADDAQIQFLTGSDAGRTFVVSGSSVSRIGRRLELEIALDARGDMIVSGNHCSISFQDGAWILTDTSRNGTYVNNELVDGSVELRDGDVVMLGDGGPQAKFRSQSAGVHYPNVARMETAAAAFAQEELSSRDTPVEESLPFSSSPESTEATPISVPAVSPAPAQPVARASSASSVAQSVEPSTTGYSLPRRGKWWIWPIASIVGFFLILGLIKLFSPDTEKPTPKLAAPAPTVDYGKILAVTRDLESEAGFYKVSVPESWRSRQQGGMLSVESPDKEVAVDYVRHLDLTPESVKELVGQGNHPVAQIGQSQSGGVGQVAFVSRSGGIARIGVLHQPENGVPALAMLETSSKILPKLPESVIQKLLVDNVKLDKVAGYEPVKPTPAPTPATTPTPSVQIAAATPSPTSAATPVHTVAPTPSLTPAPAVTPATTPLPTTAAATTPAPVEAPTSEPASTPATGTRVVESQAMGVTLNLPDGWTGTAIEDEGIVDIQTADAMSVRLARDPEPMSMDAVLTAMEAEGWKQAGVKGRSSFSAAELARGEERLLLVLVPAKPDGTNIIYATRQGSFTAEQRDGIVQLVQQLR